MKQKNIEDGAGRIAAERTVEDCAAANRAGGNCAAADHMAGDSTDADGTMEDRTSENCAGEDRPAADRSAANNRNARRKSAVQSAVLFTLMHLVAAGILLWVRAGHDPASFLAKFTLVLTGLELVSVIPLWFSLKARLKEIEGGEEDAAAQ